METRIRQLDDAVKPSVIRFINSWNGDDAYRRFGSAGINGQEWLASQLTQHRRPAFVATSGDRVIGVLDHIHAFGATHFGIVVESRFRNLTIGTRLIQALIKSATTVRPFIADCDADNDAAVALLRKCRFQPVDGDGYQITWRHA